jgi:hypothetical protein
LSNEEFPLHTKLHLDLVCAYRVSLFCRETEILNGGNHVVIYMCFCTSQEPDKTAHIYGPESQEAEDVIVKVDNITGYLLNKLEENNLTDAVNVFLLSDHGFETVTPSRIINVTDMIKEMNYTVVGNSPTLHIYPENGKF